MLMKQLAAQSTALALRTWRDGVDMRVMAAVTVITLPGTFTAVRSSRYFPPSLIIILHPDFCRYPI
jgi:hypothetical protein